MASFASESHLGYHRQVNEDRYTHLECPLGSVYVVCDGMGGHGAGDIAASLAIEAVQQTLQKATPTSYSPDYWLRRAIQNAHYHVLKAPQMGLGTTHMGTTLVLLLLTPQNEAWWAHIGDSRLYLWRQGRLSRLTRDHSLVWWYIETGHLAPEQSFGHSESNQLLLAIGASRDLMLVEATTFPLPVRPDDVFLLCSDGLTGYISEERIAHILTKKTSLSEKVRHLVRAALDAGGYDNITVMLVSPASQGVATRRQVAKALAGTLIGLGLLTLIGVGAWHLLPRRSTPPSVPDTTQPGDSLSKAKPDSSTTSQVGPQTAPDPNSPSSETSSSPSSRTPADTKAGARPPTTKPLTAESSK